MKVSICIPHLRSFEAKTALCLSGLTYTVGRTRRDIELQPFTHSSANLASSRTFLVRQALEWETDYILWVDADMVFAPFALVQLLTRGKDVIGANYLRRGNPVGPTARAKGGYVYTTKAKADAGEVEPVDRMGLGLCLMKASVLQSIGPPWFGNEALGDGIEFGGEDDFLFDRLRAAGVDCYVDHLVSWNTGHLAERVLVHADLPGSS